MASTARMAVSNKLAPVEPPVPGPGQAAAAAAARPALKQVVVAAAAARPALKPAAAAAAAAKAAAAAIDDLPANFDAMTVDARRLAVHEKLIRAVKLSRRDRRGLSYGYRATAISFIYAEAAANDDLRHPLQISEARMVALACRAWSGLRSRLRPEVLQAVEAAVERPAAIAAAA